MVVVELPEGFYWGSSKAESRLRKRFCMEGHICRGVDRKPICYNSYLRSRGSRVTHVEIAEPDPMDMCSLCLKALRRLMRQKQKAGEAEDSR